MNTTKMISYSSISDMKGRYRSFQVSAEKKSISRIHNIFIHMTQGRSLRSLLFDSIQDGIDLRTMFGCLPTRLADKPTSHGQNGVGNE